jgi:hypothetical protein
MSSSRAAQFSDLVDVISKWISSLPALILMLVEMMQDKELNKNSRSIATGALIFIAAGGLLGRLPDRRARWIAAVVKVTVVVLVLAALESSDPEGSARYRRRHASVYDPLEKQIQVLKTVLPGVYEAFRTFVERLRSMRYRDKTPSDIVDSQTIQDSLFDAAMEYAATVPTEPESLRRNLLERGEHGTQLLLMRGIGPPSPPE